LNLIANPHEYDGAWIRVLAYSPGGGSRALFPGEDQFEYGDFDSSILIVDAESKLPKVSGFVQLSGQFYVNSEVSDLAGGLYRSFGTIRKIKMMYRKTSVSEQLQQCAGEKCTLEYVDGVLPLTIPADGSRVKID
jgi:hypothetical protein